MLAVSKVQHRRPGVMLCIAKWPTEADKKLSYAPQTFLDGKKKNVSRKQLPALRRRIILLHVLTFFQYFVVRGTPL
jgi:hypothetical protein